MSEWVFKDRLKAERTRQKLTQRELSVKSGVTVAAISSYEGENKPTLETALALAKALNISLEWLCGFNELREPEESGKKPLCDYLSAMLTASQLCSSVGLNPGDGGDDDGKHAYMTFKDEKIMEFLGVWGGIRQLNMDGRLPQSAVDAWIKGTFATYDSNYVTFPKKGEFEIVEE